MYSRTNCTIWVICLVAVLQITCSDDKGTDPPPDDKVIITGQVLIYPCYIDGYGRAVDARLEIVDALSSEVVRVASDTNGFRVALDTGVYDIIIKTGFTYPDTLEAVNVAYDDSLILKILSDWATPDSLFASFYWRPPTDSIGEAAERDYLDTLAAIVGPEMIEVDGAVRREPFIVLDTVAVSVTYAVPVDASAEAWQVWDRAKEVSQQLEGRIPGSFRFIPDMRPCPSMDPPGTTY